MATFPIMVLGDLTKGFNILGPMAQVPTNIHV